MELLQIQMILQNEIRLIASVTSKRNLLHNQDIYLLKQSCILTKKNLHSHDLGSGLNPRGALDFSSLYFLAKEK